MFGIDSGAEVDIIVRKGINRRLWWREKGLTLHSRNRTVGQTRTTLVACIAVLSGVFAGVSRPVASDAEIVAKLAGRGISGPERVMLHGTAYEVEAFADSLVLATVASRGAVIERRAIALSPADGYSRMVAAPAGRRPARRVVGPDPSRPLSVSTEFLLDTGVVTSSLPAFQTQPAVAGDGNDLLVVWEDWQDVIRLRAARVTSTGLVQDPVGIPMAAGDGNELFPSVGFDGTNYLVVWEDWRRGEYADIYGARVSRDGVVLDTGGFAISQALDDQWRPSVAFDGTNYLVVWQDWRSGTSFQVYGCRVSPAGQALDPSGIALTEAVNQQMAPRVAFGGSCFMVCWAEWYGACDSSHIRAARVGPAGTVLDPGGFRAPITAQFQYNPYAAWDGSNFLVGWSDITELDQDVSASRISSSGAILDPAGIAVSTAENTQVLTGLSSAYGATLAVWQDRRAPDGRSDIFAARIRPDGSVSDPGGIAVCAQEAEQFSPAVASGSGNWLVVWEDSRRGSFSDVYGARVTGSGTVSDPDGRLVSQGANEQQSAAVASDGVDYLTVWVDYRNGNADIYGIRTDADGRVLDAQSFAVAAAESIQRSPAVAFDGTNYLVVWEDWRNGGQPDIYAARVTRSGTVLDPNGIAVCSRPYEQANPAVAFGGVNCLVVWQDDRQGTRWDDIYGARITPAGQVLDPTGIPIDTSIQWQWRPAVAFNGTNYLVVWEDHCDLDTADIRGVRLSSSGTLLDAQPITIADAGGQQLDPAVVFDGTNFVSVWQDWRSGFRSDIYGARITGTGAVLDSQGLAIGAAPGNKTAPALVRVGARSVAVWADSTGSPCSRLVGAPLDAEGNVYPQLQLGLSELARHAPAGAAGSGPRFMVASEAWTGSWQDRVFCARRVWGVVGSAPAESLPTRGWHQEPEVPSLGKGVKFGGALVSLDRKIYALSGNNTSDLRVFDIASGSWSKESDVPSDSQGPVRRVKKGASLATDGTYIYVVKGSNTQEFYRYDPERRVWKELPEPGFTKRISGGSLAFDGERTLYLLCGSSNAEWKAFDIFLETWQTPTPALLPAPKWRTGSFLACDRDRVYALRVGAKTNEFYVRDSDTTWARLTDMPLAGASGRNRKARDGASGSMAGNLLYALKGGNTLEFYAYDLASGEWHQYEDVGIPAGVPRKRVKGGGSLTYSAFSDGLFALVGNNTNEFWSYARSGGTGGGAQSGELCRNAGAAVRLSPNPAAGRVCLTWPQSGRAPVRLTTYDIAGREVFEMSGIGPQVEFDVRKLTPGIYFLTVEAPTGRARTRLQVVR
jgi:hypothetical protein